MKVTTQSGTVYEFTKAKDKVRRLTKRNEVDPEADWRRASLRQDGKWLKLYQDIDPVVGLPMYLMIEPLGDTDVTIRVSSPVIGIEP